MSNALYPLGREGFLAGEIDWNGATIKAALCRGYVYDATDEYVSDLTGVTQVAVATLALPTVTQGVADAADVTLTAVPAGAACDSIIIYQASAVTGGADVATTAQRLIAFVDTATGLPVTPNGGDISIAWDSGANKIFAL